MIYAYKKRVEFQRIYNSITTNLDVSKSRESFLSISLENPYLWGFLLNIVDAQFSCAILAWQPLFSPTTHVEGFTPHWVKPPNESPSPIRASPVPSTRTCDGSEGASLPKLNLF